MHYRRICSVFALTFFGLRFVAMAQENAAPPAVHGFNDLTFKNDYITPRGLLVTNKGFTIQSVNGFAASAYHAADGPQRNHICFRYLQRSQPRPSELPKPQFLE